MGNVEFKQAFLSRGYWALDSDTFRLDSFEQEKATAT
jgi:hypothetical protein